MDAPLWMEGAQFNNNALSGQTAVITGGARGIRKALVQAFSDMGAAVTVMDISDPPPWKSGKSWFALWLRLWNKLIYSRNRTRKS